MSRPEMTPVSSSNVESIGYDKQNQRVHVRFLNGSEYTYENVPEHEFEALKNAPSVGSYLNIYYKNVHSYPYQKIG